MNIKTKAWVIKLTFFARDALILGFTGVMSFFVFILAYGNGEYTLAYWLLVLLPLLSFYVFCQVKDSVINNILFFLVNYIVAALTHIIYGFYCNQDEGGYSEYIRYSFFGDFLGSSLFSCGFYSFLLYVRFMIRKKLDLCFYLFFLSFVILLVYFLRWFR